MEVKRVEPTPENCTAVWEMLLKLHQAGGYAPMNERKAIDYGVQNMQHGHCFVAYVDDKPVGTICIREYLFWYSDTPFYQDAWFWVEPEYRKGKVGIALLKAVKDVGQREKKIVMLTITDPDRPMKKNETGLWAMGAGFAPQFFTLKLT